MNYHKKNLRMAEKESEPILGTSPLTRLGVYVLREAQSWTDDDFRRRMGGMSPVAGLRVLLHDAANEISRLTAIIDSRSHIRMAKLIKERDELHEDIQTQADLLGAAYQTIESLKWNRPSAARRTKKAKRRK